MMIRAISKFWVSREPIHTVTVVWWCSTYSHDGNHSEMSIPCENGKHDTYYRFMLWNVLHGWYSFPYSNISLIQNMLCVLAAVTQRKCEFPVRHNVPPAFETLHLRNTALVLVEQWGFWQTGTPVLLRHFHSILCYQHSVRWLSPSVGRRERTSGAHLVLLIWFFPLNVAFCTCV